MNIELPFFNTRETCTIEALRKILHRKFNEKKCLSDPEVVDASQKLDEAINKYNQFVIEKNCYRNIVHESKN